jgi:hypothetical protein
MIASFREMERERTEISLIPIVASPPIVPNSAQTKDRPQVADRAAFLGNFDSISNIDDRRAADGCEKVPENF